MINVRYLVVCLGSSLKDMAGLQNSLRSIGLELVCSESLDWLNTTLSTHDSVATVVVLFRGNIALLSAFYRDIERGRFNGIPRILIASSSTEIMLARSMGYIADEYLLEPIDISELVSRIRELGLVKTKKFGDIVADPSRERVLLRGVELALTPTEVRILLLLMERPGHVFKRREIIEKIWGRDNSIDSRTVDVSIWRIRDSLRHKVAVDPIRTVSGAGYAFDESYGAAKSRPRRGATMKRASN